jgi:hypothetical protein
MFCFRLCLVLQIKCRLCFLSSSNGWADVSTPATTVDSSSDGKMTSARSSLLRPIAIVTYGSLLQCLIVVVMGFLPYGTLALKNWGIVTRAWTHHQLWLSSTPDWTVLIRSLVIRPCSTTQSSMGCYTNSFASTVLKSQGWWIIQYEKTTRHYWFLSSLHSIQWLSIVLLYYFHSFI